MAKVYDVIVIGAGPAGSVLAAELARYGAAVLIVEKEALPRYKCCGGGITVKTVALLEDLKVNFSNLFEDKVSGVTVRYHGADHNFFEQFPLMYTVKRENFDYFLLQLAASCGADVLPETAALKVENGDNNIRVETKAGTFLSRFIAGADGAGSIIAKNIDPVLHRERIVGIESEVSVPDSELRRWRTRILLELGRIKAGYAWVFPKADHLSIGIGCMERHARNINDRYREFLASLNISHYEIMRFQGSTIPVYSGNNIFHRGKMLVMGDAAGLADPLTGEGIHNAILSARLAASVLKKSLHDNVDSDEYTTLIKDRILPELKIAGIFSKILTFAPQILFAILEKDEKVWRGCRRLLCGEITYTHVMERLKDYGGMYNFVFRR